MATDRRSAIVMATGDDEMLFADDLDEAIIGYSERCGEPPVVVYDRAKAVECLQKSGMSEYEAEDFFDFNIGGAWVGPRTPVFLVRVENE